MPLTSGSPTPSAHRAPNSVLATRDTAPLSKHPKLPGQRSRSRANGQHNRSHPRHPCPCSSPRPCIKTAHKIRSVRHIAAAVTQNPTSWRITARHWHRDRVEGVGCRTVGLDGLQNPPKCCALHFSRSRINRPGPPPLTCAGLLSGKEPLTLSAIEAAQPSAASGVLPLNPALRRTPTRVPRSA
jgi:hypothetical protein